MVEPKQAGTITALTAQRRHPDRINVFLDGQFAFGLNHAFAAGLHVGQTLVAEQLDQLQQLDALERAEKAAYRLLGHRPRSIAEVSRRLHEKGYEDGVIEQLVEKLKSIDLLNDETFGRYWIEQRETFKPRSRFALGQELRQKGIDQELIERLLSGLDEEESARRAALRQLHKWEKLPLDMFRQRLGGHLKRRGFDFAVIRLITDEMWQSVVKMDTDSKTT